MNGATEQNLNPASGPQFNESFPNVPPPPPEVKVRTLQSDLESMAKSGGATPQFQNVKAPGLISLEEKKIGNETAKTGVSWPTVAVALIALGLVVAIGYLSYQIFLNANQVSPAGETSTAFPAPPLVQPAESGAPVVGTSSGFVHRSLFKNPPDKFLTLTINNNAQNVGQLKTYTQQIKDLVSADKTSTPFFEINVKGVDGHDFSVNEVFYAAGTPVLDPQFVSQHFNPDPTIFVYRDKSGLWPGYLLALKSNENWLFLRDEAASRLEKSQKVTGFFIDSPGTSDGGFKDIVLGGQPARRLRFNSGESFVYGWFRGYLILSTSEDGLKEAVARL